MGNRKQPFGYRMTLGEITIQPEEAELVRFIFHKGEAVAEQEEKLAGNGRVLVRPSGTEALIRVMVEAQTEPVARETAELLANVIKNHGS